MDFFLDDGPSKLTACRYENRYENDENVILYEEKSKSKEYQNIQLKDEEIRENGNINELTVDSVLDKVKGLASKVKNFFVSKPKRIFTKIHQFGGCSHLMAVRYFQYSINDCIYRAEYCESLEHFKKGDCFKSNDSKMEFPRMGYWANKSDDFYKTSSGNFFIRTTEKPPYCIDQTKQKEKQFSMRSIVESILLNFDKYNSIEDE
jgi:hypothetical protein